MRKIQNKNKIYKWNKIVERKESVLMLDYLIRGLSSSNTKKVVGLKKGFEGYLYLDKSIYWDSEEAQRVSDYLNKIIKEKGYAYLRRIAKKWIEIGETLLDIAVKLSKDDNSNKNNSQLLSDLERFSQQNWKLSTALIWPLVIEKQLSNKIEVLLNKKALSENKRKEYFAIFTSPTKDTFSTKELISFYCLTSLVQDELRKKKWNKNNILQVLSKKKVKQKIAEHLQNFSWIEARWYLGSGWTEEDIVNRIEKKSSQENYKEKAKALEDLTSKNSKETLNIIKKLFLSKKEIELIETAKEYVFIRTYRTDVFNKAGFIARPFLNEIAKRIGITFEQLIFLTSKEIKQELKGKRMIKLLAKIKKRQKAFGALLYYSNVFIFEGKDIDDFRKKQKIKEVVEKMTLSTIKGIVASPGRVIGVVRIIRDKYELNKVKSGDILVTAMTTPDFVPAMERAAAFITNEGGITCHAAIVSREMNKPCIIGTKIATKVLKDGDLVEVDANKGIVKIIKKY